MTLTPDMVDTPAEVLIDHVRSDYGPGVTSPKRKTPQRTLVIEPEEWNDLGINAKAAGSERAVVLRAFVRWYNKRPGARLPQRPGD